MPTNDFKERWGRETRLLVLVVLVSLAVLFLLARFRFPAANLAVATAAPSPLGVLASRATFDELASTMNTLLTRISPRVLSVEIALEPATAESSAARLGRGARERGAPAAAAVPDSAAAPSHRLVPALRVQANLALAFMPTGFVPTAIVGTTGAPIDIVASDAQRQLVLLRTTSLMELRGDLPTYGLTGNEYVAAVDVMPGGATLQPVFVGRVDSVTDARWPGQVVAVGRGAPIPTGSFVFAIDGRFLGLAMSHSLGTAVVPPSVLDAVVGEMMRVVSAAP